MATNDSQFLIPPLYSSLCTNRWVMGLIASVHKWRKSRNAYCYFKVHGARIPLCGTAHTLHIDITSLHGIIPG